MPQGIDTRVIQDHLKTHQLKSKLNFDRHCGHELKRLKEGIKQLLTFNFSLLMTIRTWSMID